MPETVSVSLDQLREVVTDVVQATVAPILSELAAAQRRPSRIQVRAEGQRRKPRGIPMTEEELALVQRRADSALVNGEVGVSFARMAREMLAYADAHMPPVLNLGPDAVFAANQSAAQNAIVHYCRCSPDTAIVGNPAWASHLRAHRDDPAHGETAAPTAPTAELAAV